MKRLRLRFDGYIFSPKLLYSIQLGFTPYDSKDLPNGNVNIVRDAMVYYMLPTISVSVSVRLRSRLIVLVSILPVLFSL